MRRKKTLSFPKLEAHRRKKKKILRVKIYFFSSVVLLTFVGLLFLARLKSMNISEVLVSGNRVVDTENIESVAKSEISGRYFFIAPKTNVFLYPKDRIKEKLGREYPRLKEINLKIIEESRELLVEVSEREGEYTWCGENLPESGVRPEEIKCYFMDDTGYIFSEAPYFSEDVYFKFFGGLESEGQVPIGSSFRSGDFAELVLFKNMVSEMELEPSSLFISGDGVGEFYLPGSVPPPDSPKIIFSSGTDLSRAAENLQSALTEEGFRSELEGKKNDLLYIDLRFEDKVYYKFRN